MQPAHGRGEHPARLSGADCYVSEKISLFIFIFLFFYRPFVYTRRANSVNITVFYLSSPPVKGVSVYGRWIQRTTPAPLTRQSHNTFLTLAYPGTHRNLGLEPLLCNTSYIYIYRLYGRHDHWLTMVRLGTQWLSPFTSFDTVSWTRFRFFSRINHATAYRVRACCESRRYNFRLWKK